MLEQQISDYFASFLGPQKRPVQLTPSGDHYQILVPLEPIYQQLGFKVTGLGDLTGTLAPLEQGRWSIDNLAPPSPMHFTFDPAMPKAPGPITVDLAMHNLTSHSVIDPSFASPWTFKSASVGYEMNMTGGGLDQLAHVGPFETHGALTPTADGHLDFTQVFDLHDYASVAKMPNAQTVQTHMTRIAGGLHFDKLDRARLNEAFGIVQAAKAKQVDGKPIPQPEMNALLHSLILALRASAGGGGLTESLDGLEFQTPDMSFVLKHFETAFEANAPAGLLGAHMRVAIDGPSSPMIPPSALPYVPSHLALAPYVSGIGVAELTQLALDATGPDPQPPSDPSVLFSHGALVAGINDLEISVGPTAIKGSGRFEAPSPDAITGHAKVTASQFDALVKSVQKDQVLGPQALPALLLVRGLAKPDGDNLVWEIAYEAGAVTVNGTDLSTITGGKN
jgi:hypothetical protein